MDSIVPRNKADSVTAARLAGLSPDELSPHIPKLLEWLQDMNWPVARPVLEALLRCDEDLVEPVRTVLRSDDEIWKYWVLTALLTDLSPAILNALRPDIERLAQQSAFDEDQTETRIAARHLLSRPVLYREESPNKARLAVVALESDSLWLYLRDSDGNIIADCWLANLSSAPASPDMSAYRARSEPPPAPAHLILDGGILENALGTWSLIWSDNASAVGALLNGQALGIAMPSRRGAARYIARPSPWADPWSEKSADFFR